jgi:hypothetical protein
MSKVVITGNASGTGDFTIAAPNSNTNRTLTLPDEAGTVLTTAGVPSSALPAGSVLQVVNFQTGAVASGTTTVPFDDTIPQNTEGNEYMTLAITPTSATSKLKIEINAVFSSALGSVMVGSLFQDTTANALASSWFQQQTAGYRHFLSFSHNMTSGTTSATTFKFRLGGNTATTTTFNGDSGNRKFGGALASSITITEYAA